MPWTRFAAALMGAAVLIHVFAGGPDVHAPLQAALPDNGLAAFAAVLWHGITVVLIVLGYGLWVLAGRRDLALEIVLSGIQIGFAALFLFLGAEPAGHCQ